MRCNLSKLERNLLIIILFIIVFVIVKLMDVEKQSNRDDKYYKQDTLINTIVIDSIKYNIKVKDSIIIKERIQYEDKVKEIENYTDSASVELFKKLCTED